MLRASFLVKIVRLISIQLSIHISIHTVSPHAASVRNYLLAGPKSARQVIDSLGISQPTASRALADLRPEIIRLSAGRSIQYALRDKQRGLPDIPVHRVDAEGRVGFLGTLVPVRPEGFVMLRPDGAATHSEGLPWWLYDMRPQGYLGRAYCTRHAAALGLPPSLSHWTDTDALRALLAQGHDLVGNLLLGEAARSAFLEIAMPEPVAEAVKDLAYGQLAAAAAQGEMPGSSAGGEQPKFTTCAMTPDGPRHVIVKFSEPDQGLVQERWRDLLLAEHLALQTLSDSGVPAATTRIIDSRTQRFLEVERFDREGLQGRRGLISLAALDAAFVGAGTGSWPEIVWRLVEAGHVQAEAAHQASVLWAFGTLIGNSDMHGGNLSFLVEQGRPYALAPAYDMLPMALSPRSGGGLPETLAAISISAAVPDDAWRKAEALAQEFLSRMEAHTGFSDRFASLAGVLAANVEAASKKIRRLG
jgi:hypothetical protein